MIETMHIEHLDSSLTPYLWISIGPVAILLGKTPSTQCLMPLQEATELQLLLTALDDRVISVHPANRDLPVRYEVMRSMNSINLWLLKRHDPILAEHFNVVAMVYQRELNAYVKAKGDDPAT